MQVMRFTLAAIGAAIILAPLPAHSEDGAADAVKAIYVQAIADAKASKGEAAETALEGAVASGALKTLSERFGTLDNETRMAGIDYSIFFNTQADQDLAAIEASLAVTAKEAGDVALVTAAFERWKGENGATKLIFVMVKEGGAWKMDDILYGENTLREGIYEGLVTGMK